MESVGIIEQVPMGRKSAFLLSGDVVLRNLQDRYQLPRLELCNQSQISSMTRQPHVFTMQITEGHWLIYCTKIHEKHLSFLINLVDSHCYLLSLNFSAEVHKGTVFYGEHHKQIFFVNDILVLKGDARFAKHATLHKRLDTIKTILATEFNGDPLLDCFEFHQKPYYSLSDLCHLQRLNDMLRGYKIPKARGLLFVPCEYPPDRQPKNIYYQLQHHELRPNSSKDTLDTTMQHLLKLKPVSTLPDVYSAQYGSGKEQRDMGYVHIADAQQSLKLQHAFQERNEIDLPCAFNRNFKRWEPQFAV